MHLQPRKWTDELNLKPKSMNNLPVISSFGTGEEKNHVMEALILCYTILNSFLIAMGSGRKMLRCSSSNISCGTCCKEQRTLLKGMGVCFIPYLAEGPGLMDEQKKRM